MTEAVIGPVIVERRTAYAGYLTVERLRMRSQDGTEFWREVERHGNAAAVLPYDTTRRCALTVRRPRIRARGDHHR